jgi:hypothetical protein
MTVATGDFPPTEPFRITVRHDDGEEAQYDVLEVEIYGEFVVRVDGGTVNISALHQDEDEG